MGRCAVRGGHSKGLPSIQPQGRCARWGAAPPTAGRGVVNLLTIVCWDPSGLRHLRADLIQSQWCGTAAHRLTCVTTITGTNRRGSLGRTCTHAHEHRRRSHAHTHTNAHARMHAGISPGQTSKTSSQRWTTSVNRRSQLKHRVHNGTAWCIHKSLRAGPSIHTTAITADGSPGSGLFGHHHTRTYVPANPSKQAIKTRAATSSSPLLQGKCTPPCGRAWRRWQRSKPPLVAACRAVHTTNHERGHACTYTSPPLPRATHPAPLSQRQHGHHHRRRPWPTPAGPAQEAPHAPAQNPLLPPQRCRRPGPPPRPRLPSHATRATTTARSPRLRTNPESTS